MGEGGGQAYLGIFPKFFRFFIMAPLKLWFYIKMTLHTKVRLRLCWGFDNLFLS